MSPSPGRLRITPFRGPLRDGAGGKNLPAPILVQTNRNAQRLDPPRRWMGVFPLIVVLLLSGCGSLVGAGSSVETTPGPLPREDSLALVLPPRPQAQRLRKLSEASVPVLADPILESPWVQADGMEDEVQRWIESFQTREAGLFREALARIGRYREMVDGELRARHLPLSLAYLPIVESWYSPTAVSWVGAAGLWQFMPPTARGMGLTVNRLVDERRDPFRATPSALDFLVSLRERFGSWFLALAAYNGGPGRMERILRENAPGEEGHDGLFWEVRGDFPRETQNFVPRFLAAARIARDPTAYGFGDALPEGALAFDAVEVTDATSLDVVARAAEVDLGTIESLNPQLLRGLTPAGVPTRIRVPLGKGAAFARNYAQIPPEERVTFLEHVVVAGETLSHIARYHAVSVADLQAANPLIQPRLLGIGQRVIVPKAPSVRDGLRGKIVADQGEVFVYTVRSGDTLGDIAARYRVALEDLLRWNQFAQDVVIHPGDEVRIYPSEGR
jgi:membrane-bound lytic murein transglycosylase D